MKKVYLLLTLSLVTFLVSAQQNNSADTIDYNKEFTQVQIPPMFPGGIGVWKIYLERNGLKVGVDSNDNETAIVSFLVGKQGNVSEVMVRNEDKINLR